MDNTDIKDIAATNRIFRQEIQNVPRNSKSVGSEILSELLPFKPVMLRLLKKRGYNVQFVPFKTLVVLYYNEFVSNYQNFNNYFQPVNAYEFVNNPVFRFSFSDNLNGEIGNFRNKTFALQVSNVVNGIVNNFRDAMIKKRSLVLSGTSNFDTAMTDEEISQAKATEKIEKDLENKMSDSQPLTFKNLKTVFIIAGVLLLLYYIFD